ncbi:MAG: M28 family peptidase [Candidatus Cloacimonetes bacterium]|nr:M28 family peptidase [Candidatus Cloacimonadota bacterium]
MTDLNANRIKNYLQELCNHYPHRCTGSIGNNYAATYFLERAKELGFEVTTQDFDCIDWYSGEVLLTSRGLSYQASPSPWSLGTDSKAELISISNLKELKEENIQDKIVLLRGEIAKEQLMPKNFIFYNPEEHQEIIKLLEQKHPKAIITATEKNPELVGAVYPFPLFEDGDFNIPSVYMTAEEGSKLLEQVGRSVHLKFKTIRIPASGFNVIARKGNKNAKKIVISAHIDTKLHTPGALDNATGVVIMLSMMELLKDYHGEHCIEFLAMNGEDYYAASGEMKYLAENEGKFSNIMLNINIDGAAYKGAKTGYSLMCDNPTSMEQIIEPLRTNPVFKEIEPWYQGDHMIFFMQGVPALTITSDNLSYILTEIAHTEKDTIDKVDHKILAETARALALIIRKI